jgi:4'-phosphopantetheinyl transferase
LNVLGSDEVHVWHGTLAHAPATLAQAASLLSDDERERAARFVFDRDRLRYIAGRAQLRLLLSRYLGEPAASLRFAYGAFEKPYVPGCGLQFNVSHSADILLIALTRAGELGVDVEALGTDLAGEQIAERFFSPREVAVLRALPSELQATAFLTCWTRKEAFIKARGDGLSLALDSFDVTLAPGQPAALERTAWSQDEPRKWCLADLSDVDTGYVAALAVHSTRALAIGRYELPGVQQALSEQENR